MDAIVGELIQTLKETGMLENTLILFTSDNGPEVPTVVAMRRDHQHDGARPWRGMKRDQWEGGHRVPFFAYWKNRIPAGTLMPETICLTDIMATVADLVGASLPEDAAEDSFNILPYLLEPFSRNEPIRPFTLHQTISLKLAIRKGPWKYLDHLGSGGNRYDRPNLKAFALPETAPEAKGQLYRLDVDPGETHNLIERFPSIAGELKEQLETWKKGWALAPTLKHAHLGQMNSRVTLKMLRNLFWLRACRESAANTGSKQGLLPIPCVCHWSLARAEWR